MAFADDAALQRFLEMEDHAPPHAALAFDADVAAIASWAAAQPPDGAFLAATPPSQADSDSSGHEGAASRRRKRPKSTPSSPRTSPPSSVADEDPKPRKPTYLVRKEEKSSLNDEIRVLEAHLELLKVRNGLPTGEEKKTLSCVQAANFEIEEAIHSNLLGIARFHSLLSRHLHSIPVSPMKTHIHLSKDITERRATLRAMRDMKLRRSQELTENRMRYVDNTKPYTTEERYFTDDGVYRCKRFEIVPFENVHSAKQVYDALMYYHSNVEIAVSDTLGKLTIREDMDIVDPTIWNHRIVSAMDTEGKYVQELNTVGFSQFYETADRQHSAHVGIVALDAVDVDELYPYKPHERVRKDVTAAMSVSEVRVPGTAKPIVVLRRCTFLALHPAQYPLPSVVVEDMRAGIADWCGVMTKFLRNALSAAADV